MQVVGGRMLYSATDVVDACGCPYILPLEHERLSGRLRWDPPSDPEQELVTRYALAHERNAREALFADAKRPIAIDPVVDAERAAAATTHAMTDGADVIYQGTLLDPPWIGRPDFLVRVDGDSRVTSHHYEVVDAKLARHARGQALVQAAFYGLLLERFQGRLPKHMRLWLGTGEVLPFRTADFAAYAEVARHRLLETTAKFPSAAPDPVPHCGRCRYRLHCDGLRRAQDHLFSLPGIQKRQMTRLREAGITTVAALAEADPERPAGPPATAALARLVRLAQLRVNERREGRPQYAFRGDAADRGLARLPKPSDGDVFFDIEGDPWAESRSLEYLWGWLVRDGDQWRYEHRWAHTLPEERTAFEAFVDVVTALRGRWPDMHVYHYAAYEVSALKRLMGRHGTREERMDALLRGQVFVDLYPVVREGLLVSRESCSLKDLEPLYMDAKRGADVKTATGSIVAYDLWKTTRDDDRLEPIRAYNEEDCRSTESLRGWLEARRAEAGVVTRPQAAEEAPSPAVSQRALARAQPAAALEGGPGPEALARALLTGLLHWYWREQRPQWWAFFARQQASVEDLFEDGDCIAGLERVGADGGRWHFRFDPSQDFTLHVGDTPCDPATGKTAGTLAALDPRTGTLSLASRADLTGLRALIPAGPLSVNVQEEALARVAIHVAEGGLDGEGRYRHLRDLVAGRLPRFEGLTAGAPLSLGAEDPVEAAKRLSERLDDSYLAVQGPPGTGKTYLAAAVIAHLLQRGLSVGVTAQSHKVIGNLLVAVDRALGPLRSDVGGVQRSPASQFVGLPWIVHANDNTAVKRALGRGAQLVAGTAWLFAREEMDQALDVLVVDEAGQYALADAVASGTAARSLILVGDPQQLPQVVQGSHPPGVAVSALEHILGPHETMPPDRGLFLPVTRRLHPELTAFISGIAYEDRLAADPRCSRRALVGPAPWSEIHLCRVPVCHDGHARSSDEEAQAVRRVVDRLLACRFRDEDGLERPMTPDDILIVAPFNAHVQRVQSAVPEARVGTVDRFQGQEAPAVIYTTAASDPEQVPHGMEFLFSLNRLNVAISRAQVLAVWVGSPRLLEAWSDDPEQLRLVNALCRFALAARTVALAEPTNWE